MQETKYSEILQEEFVTWELVYSYHPSFHKYQYLTRSIRKIIINIGAQNDLMTYIN